MRRFGKRNISISIKQEFEHLMGGETIWAEIDEQIVYGELNSSDAGVWSLLLASGYLKVVSYEDYLEIGDLGIPKERIRKYGFAFCGKKVLIGRAEEGVNRGMFFG